MSEDRFHRDDPLRTDPIRNFATTLRGDSGSAGAGGAAPGPTDPPPWMGAGSTAGGARGPSGSDFVLHGIRVGNAVMQDQMQRGQAFAEQLAAGLGAPSADLRQVLERMLRSYSGMYVDTALLWMDLLTPFRMPGVTTPDQTPGTGPIPVPAPGADLRRIMEQMLRSSSGLYVDSMLLWMDLLFPRPPQPPTNPVVPEPGAPSAQIPVTVLSARPTRASLSLYPAAKNQPLQACQLWARDTTKPPLMDASFQTGSDGKLFLRVRVPDNQPADLYLGVICHQGTGEPLGTLAVEIRQP